MSHIYRELKPIPIPDFCLINRGNGRVFISTRTKDNRRNQLVLGRAVKDPVTGTLSLMYPNDTFRMRYPAEWAKVYGEPRLPFEFHIGLYCATLAIGRSTGLYDILQEAMGPKSGNAVMDYAMFLLRSRSNTTQLFAETMRTQALFSERAYEDTWYSELFGSISSEEINALRSGWLDRCKANGTKRVWLCIDGSNNDCAVSESRLAARGAAKSHKNVNIVSYIWAVDEARGVPVTWFVNHGGMVDAKAIKRLVKTLTDKGIDVAGIILDRGFCSQEVMSLIEECGYAWVIMLKESTAGFKEMYKRHSAEIRCQVRHIVDQKFLFGITDKVKLFKESTHEDCVALFYDHVNGAARAEHLSLKILSEKAKLTKKLAEPQKANGKETISVSAELRPYLEIVEEEGVKKVVVKEQKWQEALEAKGFYAIASSEDMTADEIDERYDCRDASEKQFMILKNQLGFHTTRVYSDKSIESKFAAALVAAIIRSQMLNLCKRLGFDVNKMILETDRCRIFKTTSDTYDFTNDMLSSTSSFLAGLGLSQRHFEAVALDISNRAADQHFESMTRTLLPLEETKLNPQNEEEPVSGNDNEPKQESQAAAAEDVAVADEAPPKAEPVRRGPGRPRGSLNQKTLEKQAQAEEERRKAEALGLKVEEPVKRKPGRPKGSKNKSTPTQADLSQETKEKRKAGRPKGAWNQKRIDREVARLVEAARREAAQKAGERTVGRPKGRKNDKTLEKEAREKVMALMRAEQERLQKGETGVRKPV